LINVSDWTFEDDILVPEVVVRDDLLAFCESFDASVVVAGVNGFVLSLALLFYFGRFRPFFVSKFGSKVSYLDRALVVILALLFGLVISNSLFFG